MTQAARELLFRIEFRVAAEWGAALGERDLANQRHDRAAAESWNVWVVGCRQASIVIHSILTWGYPVQFLPPQAAATIESTRQLPQEATP